MIKITWFLQMLPFQQRSPVEEGTIYHNVCRGDILHSLMYGCLEPRLECIAVALSTGQGQLVCWQRTAFNHNRIPESQKECRLEDFQNKRSWFFLSTQQKSAKLLCVIVTGHINAYKTLSAAMYSIISLCHLHVLQLGIDQTSCFLSNIPHRAVSHILP